MEDVNRVLSPHEERELERVYGFLLDFTKRRDLSQRIVEIDKLQSRRILRRRTSAISDDGSSSTDCGEEEYQQKLNQVDKIQKELDENQKDFRGHITALNLHEALKSLGYKCSRKQVLEMIWEVDDDLDGEISWEELKVTFQRNLADTNGIEPSQLFHFVQFLIYDKDFSGNVSVDEILELFYARYGRANLDERLREFFGRDLKESAEEDIEMTLNEYLNAVSINTPTPRRLQQLIKKK